MNSWCLSDDIVDLVTVNVILVCNPVLSMNKIGGPSYNGTIEDNIVCQEIKYIEEDMFTYHMTLFIPKISTAEGILCHSMYNILLKIQFTISKFA